MAPLERASMVRPPGTSSVVVPRSPWLQTSVLRSTVASVLATILLTAMATPADSAVAPPFWPWATASDTEPAMAKMSALSMARTTRSLPSTAGRPRRVSAPSMATLLSSSSARVPPCTVLMDTLPASEPAKLLLLLVLLPPLATAPAPPAARLQMLPLVSASTCTRVSVVSTVKDSKSTRCTLSTASATRAWVSASMAL